MVKDRHDRWRVVEIRKKKCMKAVDVKKLEDEQNVYLPVFLF